MKYNTLSFGGELWVAYPAGLRFPSAFAQSYPFRGRRIVSKVLYSLNRLHIDKVLLRKTEMVPFVKDIAGAEGVAFFWPSRKRSTGRFYGYKVSNDRICEYWKIGVTEQECERIKRESHNSNIAAAFAEGVFEVAKCLGVEDGETFTIARYEPLPACAKSLSLTDEVLAKVKQARLKIAAAGYQHGDFGWHNLKICGDKLWVLDWEEMSQDLPKLTDEISFEIMRAHYNKGLSIQETWSLIKTRYCKNHARTREVLETFESMYNRKIALETELLLLCRCYVESTQ